MTERCSRRRVLRRAGLTVSVVSLGGLAGCPGRGGDGGPTPTTEEPDWTGRGDDGGPPSTTEQPDWTGPEYARWLPAPEPERPFRSDGYQFWALDLTEFADHPGRLPPGIARATHFWEPLPVDWEAVPRCLVVGGTNVLRTEFDREQLLSHVTDAQDWLDHREYRGFDLLALPKEKAIAIGDRAIVVAADRQLGASVTDRVTRLLDARAGAVDRYLPTEPSLEALLTRLGEDGFLTNWRPVEVFETTETPEPTLDGQVAIGRWGTFLDDRTSRMQYLVVFEDEAATDPAGVERFLDEHSGLRDRFGAWNDPTVRSEGRFVLIEGTVNQNLR